MKNFFPAKNKTYTYLQTNRSDIVGSLWSSFNLDFQSNLGALRLAQKLVTNTTSSDDSDLGVTSAFEFWSGKWWAICDTTIFNNTSADIKIAFAEQTLGYSVGSSTSRFDVTNPAGTTFRYTWDGTGTDPGITALTFPIGSVVTITQTNLAVGNQGTFTITGSGANYFEVTNATGVVEVDKTISTGNISIAGGSTSKTYSFVYSDLTVFDDRLWSTSATTLYSTGSYGWVSRDTLTSDVVHKLVYFKHFDRLYYSNGEDTISSINSSNAVADPGADYAISLGTSIGSITTLVSTSNFIWIGTTKSENTSADNGTQGSILAWDGFSAQVTNEYILPAGGCLAMTVLNDVPYAIDSEGRILKFTGYSFEELGRLPIDRILLLGATYTAGGTIGGELLGRFVHFNGMQATKNNTLLVMLKNPNEDGGTTISENLPSGIWEFDLGTNSFTHRYSTSLKSLASSTVTDFGQNRIKLAGALKLNTFAANTIEGAAGRSTLLAGAKYYTTATATKSAIFIDSPAKPTTDTEGQKRGYFVTTWFNSEEIQDKWTRLWTTFRRFLAATDKMIFKYRLNEESPIYATILWINTTLFRTSTDLSVYAPTIAPFNGTTGGEVEVTQGSGSGGTAHITSISSGTEENIAFDAFSTGNAASSPVTVSHTCTGSNRILFVAVMIQNAGNGDTLTGVTYNGVAMNFGIKILHPTVIGRCEYIYYLQNPASGTHNIVATASAVSSIMLLNNASYTGAKQTGTPTFTSYGPTISTSETLSFTTTTNFSWLFAFFNPIQYGGAVTAQSGTTLRTQSALTNGCIGDSGTSIYPAGTSSLGVTYDSSIDWTGLTAIIEPATGSTQYIVTLDNAIPNTVATTAVARFQKWIKLYPEVTGQVNSYAQLPIGDSNVRIQIKGVLEWTGDDEFYKMAIVSNEDIKINP